jgi:O-antigen/teichoic acid export membrane protein
MGVKVAAAVILIALIQGVLSLYRQSVVLDAYGDKITGVVQAALQMSAYLVLFQTGMSAAYQYNMYAPLTQSAFPKVSALFSGLKKSMLRVSGKMLLIALAVIPVYSALLLNQGVKYWDTLLILAAIGIRISAPFFYTLPERCLIEIREKKYLVVAVEGAKDIATLVTEIVLILFTTLPLPLILCVNLVYLFLSKWIYRHMIRRLYGPEFDMNAAPEYVASKMTKAVYAHQISSMVTSNTDNVVLSLLSSLRNVTMYSNIALLISYPNTVIYRIIEGMRATLALKITRGDEDSYAAFRQLLAFSFFCIIVIIPVFLLLANPFVTLWVGADYQISWLPLLLFGLMLADYLLMPVIYAARDARGLYPESQKFTIVQAIVNLVISVALAAPFGITGVLAGTIAAAYFVLQPGNFRLVYRNVFQRRMTIYYELAVVAALCAASYFGGGFVISRLALGTGWLSLIVHAAVSGAIAAAVGFAGLYLTHSGFRALVKRFLRHPSASA